MKKIITLIIAIVSFYGARGQAAIVSDPGVLAQSISIATAATSQVSSLMSILNISEEQIAKLSKVTNAITTVSQVQYIISIGISTANLASDIILFASRPTIINPRTALNYTGRCIYSTEVIIRNIERLTSLVTDMLIDASAAERIQLIDNIRKDIEIEEQSLKKVKGEIEMQMQITVMQKMAFAKQGIKINIK